MIGIRGVGRILTAWTRNLSNAHVYLFDIINGEHILRFIEFFRRYFVSAPPVDEFEYFFEKPWSDGLPVIPPTEERLGLMLAGTNRAPDEVIGDVPPLLAQADVRTIAVHAVMAGCKPEYMPVLIGAVEAILEEKFNAGGVQATLSCAAPLLIVNGPYARKIGIHGGLGCFGPGNRANATIGRAIRLLLLNVGGGIPGITSMSTFSQPGRFTFCIAENEEESPWESLALTKGFGADADVVTVVHVEGPVMVWDDVSNDPERMFPSIADTMSHLGAWNCWASTDLVVAMSPQQAAICAKRGYSKTDVHGRLCEIAGRTVGELKTGGHFRENRIKDFPIPVDLEDDDAFVPTIKEAQRLLLIVAGGIPGPMTAVMHGWNGSSHSVSRSFESW